jgi:hypothetical protein
MKASKPIIAALVALGSVAVSTSAAAAKSPAINLSGQGTFELSAGAAQGDVAIESERYVGTGRVVLRADDGSLPAPGDCEPGNATVEIEGPRKQAIVMVSTGEVCGQFVSPPFVVTHRYVGRYTVIDARPKRLVGGDGFISVVLGNEGQLGLELFDS